MQREVTVGRKHPSVRAGKLVVSVEYDNRSDVGGATLHVTVLIDEIPEEPDHAYVPRAALEAKRLIDSMSAKIAMHEYRERSKFVEPAGT